MPALTGCLRVPASRCPGTSRLVQHLARDLAVVSNERALAVLASDPAQALVSLRYLTMVTAPNSGIWLAFRLFTPMTRQKSVPRRGLDRDHASRELCAVVSLEGPVIDASCGRYSRGGD